MISGLVLFKYLVGVGAWSECWGWY